MRYSKVFKREDGSQVEITAVFVAEWINDSPKWSFKLAIRAPKKRNWYGVVSTDDYSWRRLTHEERDKYVVEKYLQYCTPSEVLEVQLEAWEKMKPCLGKGLSSDTLL